MPKPGDFAQFRSQVEKDYIDAKATELMQAAAKKALGHRTHTGQPGKSRKRNGIERQNEPAL